MSPVGMLDGEDATEQSLYFQFTTFTPNSLLMATMAARGFSRRRK